MPSKVASQVGMIPGYRLMERIWSGGFGEVWKAEAPGGMHKAVKIIHGDMSNCIADETRLDQELKSLHRVKAIRHPYILSLERFDIIDGRLIIVSELADRTLFDRFTECRSQGRLGIPREELLGYMTETAEALDLMNEQFNLQHLDIKPQNIFLLFNHVKVGDFGLVKDLEGMFGAVTSGVTAVYAAPETFEGVVSRYCDQYNLAIAFQEMLTGTLPFDGTTSRQLMRQHLMSVPNLKSLPAADQPVVARALSKKPDDRFARCTEFVRALRQASHATASDTCGTLISSLDADTVIDQPAVLWSPKAVEEHPTANVRLGDRPNPQTTDPPTPSGEHHVIARPGRTPTPDHPLDQPSEVVEYVPPPPPPELPETTGDGILLPALVVGLGGVGKDVLQEFRKALRKRGAAETWPHIRLLHIDTDSEAHDRALGEPDSVLSAEETLVAMFHRPSHYLKRTHDRADLERWMPLNQLSSIGRGQTTAEGWRALGRLAFISSRPAISFRLHQELQACADERTVMDAGQRTSLGLRTTRPRVYVVTSLTGGTGSGMFLDLAASLRSELRDIGHPRAELVGVLLVSAVDRSSDLVSSRGVANCFAALRELQHFAAAQKGSGNPGPFDRCVLLPLPAKSAGAAAFQEAASLTGDFLCRELTTDLGRIADEDRSAGQHSGPGPIFQTFGSYWFSVPLRQLLRRVVHHVCYRLVHSWGIHDVKALAAVMQTWAANKLTHADLGPEMLANRLEEASVAALDQPLKSWREVLTQQWAKGESSDLKNPIAVQKTMKELTALLGPPQGEPDFELDSPVLRALGEAYRFVSESADGQLGEIALSILSEPHFRLAYQEEVAQEKLGIALDEAAKCNRRRSDERRKQAYDYWQQIPARLDELQARGLFRGGARARAADAIRTLLAQYLSARWDCVLALAASRLCQDLRANLHQHRRAVACCHKRIGQFVKTFADSAANAPPVELGLGRYLLPYGCQTLEEAVACILNSMPADEQKALNEEVWRLIQSTLHVHVHVCTASASVFRELRERIDGAAEKVAADSLVRAHAATLYVQRQDEQSDADADLAGAFDEAQPELSRGRRQEISILAVPPGPEGERFRAMVKHALPDVPMHAAASTDDIVFYREQSFASLDELPQLGPAAREQYQHILTTAQFGPHSRTDIAW